MALLLAFSSTCSAWADTPNATVPFRVAGYLPSYRIAKFDAQAAGGLTDLFIFSAQLAKDGSLDVAQLKNVPWPKLLHFKNKHGVRLILTIGGWKKSQNFAAVAGSDEKRKRCAQSVAKFAMEKKLDGIDLDWEHPKNAEEEIGYGQLLTELRKTLGQRGLLLSVTIAPQQQLTPAAVKAVHYVQLMSYDHGGKHSTLEQARKDVKVLLNAKVPASKIVLGMPFYGRDIQRRTAMSYRDIVSNFSPATDADQVGQIFFNGPETIGKKTNLAIQSKLAGVMVWELGQDAKGDQSLLKVIHKTVREGGK